MNLQILNPSQKLKASLLKQHLKREQIELFKENIKSTFANIIESEKRKESEEHLKTIVRDFLRDTYYKDSYAINTKDRKDLVIHNGKDYSSNVGVLIETKQPSNKAEMISKDNVNAKSFQQLLSYYLHERFINNNKEIKHIIITNIYEWYIFDASDFEKFFFEDKKLRDNYKDWEQKNIGLNKTDWFYKEIIKPYLEDKLESIPCTYFNLKDYETIINNDSVEDDEALLDLYKILSPEHLLKKQVANDSNSLNKEFYNELLHILGIEEVKEGSKKTIKRVDESRRNAGSILENTITKLKSKYREITHSDDLYSIGLELTITWLNRILFLKLLEGQLIKYNNSKEFAFLNTKNIKDYDELEELFFEVLAVPYNDREQSVIERYGNIPYLNSSLFEETQLEKQYFGINVLKDRLAIPIYHHTVFNFVAKGSEKLTLEYLLEFLDAYDFGDESKGKIKEQSKSIINASVLGLIFEKINGYKDGSFFTPSFITMYMCRESIRRAVVQKFNDTYNWNCEEFIDLRNEIKSIKKLEANSVINTLRICDPAVGSGHFLVSALNEMISIKQDLKILIDKTGEDFSEYSIEIENDELIIKDEKGNPYSYNVSNKESRRVQETLFNEKQTIIENCLFGVDINPKSVMICRLRLWIELLKNSYYIFPSSGGVSEGRGGSSTLELQTLPNIDINIKCGNSLISRFEVKDSVFEHIPNFKQKLQDYTYWVREYKNEKNKTTKAQFQKQIDEFKKGFKLRDPRIQKIDKDIAKIVDEIEYKFPKNNIFGSQELTAEQNKVKETLLAKLEKLSTEKTDIEQNPIYDHAFEWRFEFPEILDENGGFIGFDVVIGNPPYVFGGNEGIDLSHKNIFKERYESGKGKINLFTIFIERGLKLLNRFGQFTYIVPNTYLRVTSYNDSRKLLIDNYRIYNVSDFGTNVFEDAITTAVVIIASNETPNTNSLISICNQESVVNEINQFSLKSNYVITQNNSIEGTQILDKLNLNSILLGELCKELIFGVVITKNKDEVVSNIKKEGYKPFLEGKDIGRYYIRQSSKFLDYQPKLLHRARTKEVFEVKEKLLIQRITGGNQPLKVAYDNSQYYNKESINNLILNENSNFNIKYILALLNSKTINWFYNSQFTNSSTLTVNISKEYLSQLPIKKTSKTNQDKIVKLVDQILSLKKSNPESDTTALEAEIDRLVYELYGLTEEEVKVVENS